jgi:cell division septation protein DedD
MGVEASVQKVDVPEKGTMHRVRVGPYMGQEAMSKAREQLTASGIGTAVVKIKPKEPKPAPAPQ